MIKVKLFILTAIAVCCIAGTASAAVSFNNSICPVSGKKISRKVKVEHDGILYLFSSTEASAQFDKSPEKYLKKLANGGKIVDLKNKVCPVSAKKIQGKMAVTVDGHKIYCDSKECAIYILKNPKKSIERIEKLKSLTGKKLEAYVAKLPKKSVCGCSAAVEHDITRSISCSHLAVSSRAPLKLKSLGVSSGRLFTTSTRLHILKS
jgi:YHS domain-containing protein